MRIELRARGGEAQASEAGIKELPLYPEGRQSQAPTAQRVLEAFASVGWHEFRRGEETICFPLEMGDLQQQLLSLLGMSVRDYG